MCGCARRPTLPSTATISFAMPPKAMGVIIPALVPVQGFGYDAALAPYPFDPATARRLLREAGLGEGVALGLIASEGLQVQATVVEPLPNRKFRVVMENQHQVLAQVSRKMRHWSRLLPGDCVVVEMSPNDLNRGLIIRRC